MLKLEPGGSTDPRYPHPPEFSRASRAAGDFCARRSRLTGTRTSVRTMGGLPAPCVTIRDLTVVATPPTAIPLLVALHVVSAPVRDRYLPMPSFTFGVARLRLWIKYRPWLIDYRRHHMAAMRPPSTRAVIERPATGSPAILLANARRRQSLTASGEAAAGMELPIVLDHIGFGSTYADGERPVDAARSSFPCAAAVGEGGALVSRSTARRARMFQTSAWCNTRVHPARE